MHIRDAVFGLVFACLGIFMLIQASGFPSFPGQPYGASLMPGLLGAGFIIAGVLLAIRDFAAQGAGNWVSVLPELRTTGGLGAMVLIVATVLAHILISPHLGFIPVSIVCLTALQLWFRLPILPALVIAVAGTALCWVLFAVALKVPLPRGVLEGII